MILVMMRVVSECNISQSCFDDILYCKSRIGLLCELVVIDYPIQSELLAQ